jgi:hypothetical protein
MKTIPRLAIVPNNAEVLLDLLAPGEPVTFQTFGQGNAKGKKGLTRTAHGTIGEHWRLLTDLNERGAAVCWMVNASDLKGRKLKNVQYIRALFVDLDGSPLGPVTQSPLQPHVIVESSPGRWHAYWRVADCPLSQFPPYQRLLAAYFNGDDSASDLTRVLRLPGFNHEKTAPFRSHIVTLNDVAPYVLADFNRAFNFPPYTEAQSTQAIQAIQAIQDIQVRGKGAASETVVTRFIPDAPGQRQRNRCLFDLARHLKARMPNATRAELRDVVKQWHELALPVIGTIDFNESWGDFCRGWKNVRHPEGERMSELLKDVDADRLPRGLPSDYEPLTLRLVRICGRLQRTAGEGPFYLSSRTAGALLDVHYTSAANFLCALVADGVMECVTQGSHKNRQASEYRMMAMEPGA